MPEPSKSALTLSNHLVISIMLENALTCLRSPHQTMVRVKTQLPHDLCTQQW